MKVYNSLTVLKELFHVVLRTGSLMDTQNTRGGWKEQRFSPKRFQDEGED